MLETYLVYGGIGVVLLVVLYLLFNRRLGGPPVLEQYDCNTRRVRFRCFTIEEEDPEFFYGVALACNENVPSTPDPSWKVSFTKVVTGPPASYVSDAAISTVGAVSPTTGQRVVIWTEKGGTLNPPTEQVHCGSCSGSGSGSGFMADDDDDGGGGGGGGRKPLGGRGKYRIAPREYELAFGPPLDTDVPWVAGVDRRGNVPLAHAAANVEGIAGVWRGRVGDVAVELKVCDAALPVSAELRVVVPANGVPEQTIVWRCESWAYTAVNRLIALEPKTEQGFPNTVAIFPRQV
jgi:hypothetical protein